MFECEDEGYDGDAMLDRLIDASLEKIHMMQVRGCKDERKRVLVVSMMHNLLLKKIESLQTSLDLHSPDSNFSSIDQTWSRREAAQLVNQILQEKIGCLGYGRTVKIWVGPPKRAGQDAMISCPVKGQKGKSEPSSGCSGPVPNEMAPSGREPSAI